MGFFKMPKFLSTRLSKVWFSNFLKPYESISSNKVSLLLVKYRNFCLICHLFRLFFIFFTLFYFSLSHYHKFLLLAQIIDFILFFIGIYATLTLKLGIIRLHRYLMIGNFLWKLVIIWWDLLSLVIISLIFERGIEIWGFMTWQIVFLVMDIVPVFTIFILFQIEAKNCIEETGKLMV